LRQADDERIMVAINPAAGPVEVALPAEALSATQATPETLWGTEGGLVRAEEGWRIALSGASAGIYRI
jgi:hypothetical protein